MDKKHIALAIAGAAIILIVTLIVLLIIQTVKKNRLKSMVEKYKDVERKRERILQEKYDNHVLEKMVSMKLMEVLDVKENEEISFESQRSARMVTMYVDCNEFNEMLHRMSAKDIFRFINNFMEPALTKIEENGGIVQEFQQAGMKVVFLQDFEQAVVTAVSVCEILRELGKKQPEYNNFSIGLNYENTILGVVGSATRMSMLALSAETLGFSEWLQNKAEMYYSKIMVTEDYLELIENYQKKFNIRFLGYVYITDTDSIKKVYDVFDGDDMDTRNRKRQTKMIFEKGISFFAEQDFEEARKYFIEVLKADRYDKAAREYVYRCEQYIKDTLEAPIVFFEKY